MIAQDAHARCTLRYKMIEEEKEVLRDKIVDLELQKDEMKQTLENEKATAIEDGLKKAEENAQLNQRVVADFEATIEKNLDKISSLDKQLDDERSAFKLKIDEHEKEKEASKAELNKKVEELSLLRADNNKLLIENQQFKENEKDLQAKVNLLEVEALSLNNEQREKITSLEHDLQTSKEKLNSVVNFVGQINGKQQTDEVASLAPVEPLPPVDPLVPRAHLSTQSFVDNSFDGSYTDNQLSLGAEPLNASKNSMNEEVDAKQVSEVSVAELPSFTCAPSSSNGTASPQVHPVSEEISPPIVTCPSRVTPASQMTDKRRASSPAAIHPTKKTKKDSRRQNNDNDELDFNVGEALQPLLENPYAEPSVGVHQNPVISHNLRSRTSIAVSYKDDTDSNSDEADNYSESEDETTGMNRNNMSLRSRSCAVNNLIQRKFTANEYEFQSSRKHDKVIVLAPGNKCYTYHYQKKGKSYRCYGCSDFHGKHTVCGTIERDDKGEEYFWAYDDHVCEPQDYSNTKAAYRARRGSKATIKIYDFEMAKTRTNGIKVVVPVINTDPKMCHFFYGNNTGRNYYFCGNCNTLNHSVAGGFGEDENGKEYFETPNDHVCKPRVYKPAEIINTNAHHSESQQ